MFRFDPIKKQALKSGIPKKTGEWWLDRLMDWFRNASASVLLSQKNSKARTAEVGGGATGTVGCSFFLKLKATILHPALPRYVVELSHRTSRRPISDNGREQSMNHIRPRGCHENSMVNKVRVVLLSDWLIRSTRFIQFDWLMLLHSVIHSFDWFDSIHFHHQQ